LLNKTARPSHRVLVPRSTPSAYSHRKAHCKNALLRRAIPRTNYLEDTRVNLLLTQQRTECAATPPEGKNGADGRRIGSSGKNYV